MTISAAWLMAWYRANNAFMRRPFNQVQHAFWPHRTSVYKMGVSFPGWFWVVLPIVVGCVVFAVWRQLRAVYR